MEVSGASSKQGPLEQVAQDCIQWGWLHNLSDQHVLVTHCKTIFLMFKWIFFSLNLGSLSLGLSLTTTERPGSIFFPPFHKVLTQIHKILLNFSFLKPSQLSQPFLAWQRLKCSCHLCGPSLDSLHVPVSYVLGSPELPTVHYVWPHPG